MLVAGQVSGQRVCSGQGGCSGQGRYQRRVRAWGRVGAQGRAGVTAARVLRAERVLGAGRVLRAGWLLGAGQVLTVRWVMMQARCSPHGGCLDTAGAQHTVGARHGGTLPPLRPTFSTLLAASDTHEDSDPLRHTGDGSPGPAPEQRPAALAPEGDEAGIEQREGHHTQDHPPQPVVHTQLAPPHLR